MYSYVLLCHWLLHVALVEAITTVEIYPSSCFPESGNAISSIVANSSLTDSVTSTNLLSAADAGASSLNTASSSTVPSSTSSLSSARPSSTLNRAGFLIQLSAVNPDQQPRLLPRQESIDVYLTTNGETTANCLSSTVFTLSNDGVLSTREGLIYSTNPNIVSEVLVPHAISRSINTTWDLLGNTLYWTNNLFLGAKGVATFCIDPGSNTRIVAYFQTTAPANCIPIYFKAATVSECPGIEGSSSSTTKAATSSSPILSGTGSSDAATSSSASQASSSLSSPTQASSSLPSSPSTSGLSSGPSQPISARSTSSSSVSIRASGSTYSTSRSIPGSSSVSYSAGNSTRIPGSSAASGSSKSCVSSLAATTTTIVSGDVHSSKTVTVNCRPTVTEIFAERYGLAYTAFENPYNEDDDPSYQTDLLTDIARFRDIGQLTRITCGIATDPSIGTQDYVANPGQPSPFGRYPSYSVLSDFSKTAIVYQGYFYSPQAADTFTSPYTIDVTSTDTVYVWVGDKDTWNNNNAFFADITGTGGPSVGPKPLPSLNAGDLLPMTFLVANAQADITATIKFNDPDGARLTDLTNLFILPQDGDNFKPVGQPTSAAEAATCPQPPATNEDIYCGIDDFELKYHGSGQRASLVNAVTIDNYDDSYSKCTVIGLCRDEARRQGLDRPWFALYEYLPGNPVMYRCVVSDRGDAGAFPDADATVVEAWGYEQIGIS